MGFEGVGSISVAELIEAPRLNRSKSCPDSKRFQEDKFDSLLEESRRPKLDMGQMEDPVTSTICESRSSKVHESLTQEIMLLEKRLQNQFEVRHDLESALGYASYDDRDTTSMPKTATQLIRDIAVLEFEVGHLEQYLLSLYRKAFDKKIPYSPPAMDEKVITLPPSSKYRIVECSRPAVSSQKDDHKSKERFNFNPIKDPCGLEGAGSYVDSMARCQSAISQHSVFVSRSAPNDATADEVSAKTVRACHSQPLSMTEYAQNTSANLVSLAEHLGTRISDHLPETPNRLSEDMIKCMSAIYCKLSYPPLTHQGLSSPNSTPSSTSQFSPQDHGYLWSPGLRKDSSSFDVRLDNPFHVDGLKEFSGPYSTMVEVPWIYRDNQKLGDVEYLLQNFRSIISQLQEVDPRKLTREEKIAFWINIHNSLVMHAFLAFGIPQNNVKRVLLLLKAAYNIGGHTINADTIQSSILGCRMSRPGQWIRKLVPSRPKFKTGHERQAYAIDKSEPLLYFALSSGSHSDPAVRAYTPKRIFQELETAKEEYIRATFGITKDRKLILPKLLESFSKDSSLSHDDVLNTVQQSLPESLHKSLKKTHASNRSPKAVIDWVPHNFSFRYLISKELAG